MKVKDIVLEDSMGNTCRLKLYPYTPLPEGEMWLWEFNDLVPRRIIGDIRMLRVKGGQWLRRKRAAGFNRKAK